MTPPAQHCGHECGGLVCAVYQRSKACEDGLKPCSYTSCWCDTRPAPSSPTYCLKCTYPEGVCAEEDFCKGCENFDAFFNSCKLTFYKQRFGEKTGTIHPRTNASRWLLAVVGCASDTRKQIDAATIRNQMLDDVKEIVNTYYEGVSKLRCIAFCQMAKDIESLRSTGGEP